MISAHEARSMTVEARSEFLSSDRAVGTLDLIQEAIIAAALKGAFEFRYEPDNAKELFQGYSPEEIQILIGKLEDSGFDISYISHLLESLRGFQSLTIDWTDEIEAQETPIVDPVVSEDPGW